MIFREYRDGKALIREEWELALRAPDNGEWQLIVYSYLRKRKSSPRVKWFALSHRWNAPGFARHYGVEFLTTCPPIPADLHAAAIAKIAALPITYDETRAR